MTTPAASFAAAVKKARAHEGGKDYAALADSFVDLTGPLEFSSGLLQGTATKNKEDFLAEANLKMTGAAEAFISLFSFSGEPDKTEIRRAYRIFDRAAAGFIGTVDKKSQILHYRSLPPSHVLQHLWVGLPRFATDKNAAAPTVAADYESLIALQGVQTLLSMARKADVDITFTCPNAQTLYSSAKARMKDPLSAAGKAQKLDRQQELGDAFVFPNASSVFSKIVISINIDKKFEEKYPPAFTAIEQHRRAPRAAERAPAAPAETKPATQLTRAQELDTFIKANPASRLPSPSQLLEQGKISITTHHASASRTPAAARLREKRSQHRNYQG